MYFVPISLEYIRNKNIKTGSLNLQVKWCENEWKKI